ncbi:hydroxypyruvate isomerase family protein [Mycolicibacterium sp.]|uniref:hydroxypyruvate isomerase family protein n=1 Tax=Mycolicibacterium sp. TaxID=2320850 RepID=UPI003D0F0077
MTATYTVNCSILYTDLPLLDRPAAARDAGFTAVEFWWPFESAIPSDRQVSAFVTAVGDAGVQLSGLNFAAGDMPSGDRGILSNPGSTLIFRDNVDIAVGIADALGTTMFNALYGNRIDGLPAQLQDDTAIENLAFAASAADRIGASVLVEPVSGAPRYPITTAARAVDVIDRVGAPNLRLLADLYHLFVNGDDVNAAITTYSSYIGHIQIADAPGRGEPGTGQIELGEHLGRLLAGGYHGYVGLEYKATRRDPFSWLPRAQRGADAIGPGSPQVPAKRGSL